MSERSSDLGRNLRLLSWKLQELHLGSLEAERRFDPTSGGLDLLERLAYDPAWAWLRAISSLVAEINHVLAAREDITEQEGAAIAMRVRSLLFGEGSAGDEAFLERYRSLLPLQRIAGERARRDQAVARTLPGRVGATSRPPVWSMRCEHALPRLRRKAPRTS